MKDIFLSLGVIFTFVLGIWNIVYNYRNSRRTSFINTVTAERVARIGRLRADIAEFCGLTHTWAMSGLHNSDKELDILKKIDRLRYRIRLQLDPLVDSSLDRKLESTLDKIVTLCVPEPNQDKLIMALNDLILTTQKLLKLEWNKVKDESKQGDLRDNQNFLDPILTSINTWCLGKTKRWVIKERPVDSFRDNMCNN